MNKLEEKILELGYEPMKPKQSKIDADWGKGYILNYKHTFITLKVFYIYTEFNDIYVELPDILKKKKVLKEINKAFKTMEEHRKILIELGVEFC